MKDAFFLVLLMFFQISIFIHIQFITSYIINKTDGSFKGFLVTTFTNFLIGMAMLIVMMDTPDIVGRFKLEPMMVLESGLIFCFLLFIKIRITARVLKRVKSPDYYDISFFGKKVYRLDVVKKSELAIYILTMPFTLVTGAYFLVNVFT